MRSVNSTVCECEREWGPNGIKYMQTHNEGDSSSEATLLTRTMKLSFSFKLILALATHASGAAALCCVTCDSASGLADRSLRGFVSRETGKILERGPFPIPPPPTCCCSATSVQQCAQNC